MVHGPWSMVVALWPQTKQRNNESQFPTPNQSSGIRIFTINCEKAKNSQFANLPLPMPPIRSTQRCNGINGMRHGNNSILTHDQRPMPIILLPEHRKIHQHRNDVSILDRISDSHFCSVPYVQCVRFFRIIRIHIATSDRF